MLLAQVEFFWALDLVNQIMVFFNKKKKTLKTFLK